MSRNRLGMSARGYASAIAIAAGLATPVSALAAVVVASDARTTLPAAKKVGPTSSTQSISVAIMLPSRDPDGLAAFIRRVTKPGDKLFRHYLTPVEFAARYGAKPGDYKDVAAWAAARGLTPGEEYSAHMVLPLTGSTKAFEAAFGVKFTDYKGAKGNVFFNASSSPKLPVSVATKITSVIGLNSINRYFPLARKLPLGVQPQSGGTGPLGAYSASDIRTAYYAPTAPAGAPAETLAVFEQGGFAQSDVTEYLTTNGLPNRGVIARGVNGYGGGIDDPGVELEAVLDIDMEIGLNPALHQVLVYEDGQDPFGLALVNSFAAIASDDLAQTISVSYGLDEALQDPTDIQAENTALQQEVAQGQTVFVSAGDYGAYGDEGYGLNAPDPGSQPLVTSVGGTTLFTGPGEEYLDELAWNELASRGFATGGGVSSVWPIPSWQVVGGTSVAVQNGGSATNRNVPDVAAVGDPFTGVAVYSALNGGWIQIGGTSVASPIWAGYTSVVNATSKAFGFGQIGFANPNLYTIGETYYGAFNDVVDGSNGDAAIYGVPGFNAGYGFDNVSGWGSPASYLPVDWALLPALTGTNPPPAVNGLNGAVSPTVITLHWTAAAGATGYVVEGYNLSTYASTPNVFTVGTTAMTKGLTPGTQYEFEVFSISAGGTAASVPIYLSTSAAP